MDIAFTSKYHDIYAKHENAFNFTFPLRYNIHGNNVDFEKQHYKLWLLSGFKYRSANVGKYLKTVKP